jgi:uncharacterized protein (DUF362 family)
MMNRREFLRASALLGAGAAAGPGLFDALAAPSAPAGQGAGPTVAVAKGAKGTAPGAVARAAVAALGGMASFVAKGDVVVVKPNIGWDRTPDQGANTHPEVVRDVAAMCLEAGAAKVKVFDRTCNDPRRCYVTSGIAAALEAMNDSRVEVSHIDDRRFREVEIPGALTGRRWPIYEEVLAADVYINLPVAKHHGLSVMTAGMKNVMGVVGGNRSVIHRSLPEVLTDLNRAVKPRLTLVDAVRILKANGPQGGRLEDVERLDTVLASTDVVAADAVAATLFGWDPKEFRFLQVAQEQGVGVADLDRIRLVRAAV